MNMEDYEERYVQVKMLEILRVRIKNIPFFFTETI